MLLAATKNGTRRDEGKMDEKTILEFVEAKKLFSAAKTFAKAKILFTTVKT